METVVKSLWPRKIVWIISLLILIGAGYWFFFLNKSEVVANKYVLGTVEKGTITTSVAGTGQVVVLNQIEVKSK